MTDYILYLPVLLLLSLFLKKPLFNWAWLSISIAMLIDIVMQHTSMFFALWHMDLDSLSIQFYFLCAFVISYALGTLFTFKSIKKTEALAAYFYTFFAFLLLDSTTWVHFIMYFELMSIFSAILIFSQNSYQAHRTALMSLLYLVFGASCLIGGSLLVHDNNLSHFQWSFNLPTGLILLGFVVHAALFPFHGWFIRAHENASTQANFFLHVLMPLTAMYALALLLPGHPWLIYIGLASSFFAAIYLLLQHDLRKIIAYQAVLQLGLISLCIGIGNSFALKACFLACLSFVFYMPLLLAFSQSLSAEQGTTNLHVLQTQQKNIHGLDAIIFLLAGLSATGLPYMSVYFLSHGFLHAALNTSFSWLIYFVACMQVTLFFTLVLKPMHLFHFSIQQISNALSFNRCLAFAFALLVTIFAVKTGYDALEHLPFNSYSALSSACLFLGSLPLFFLFKRHLMVYPSFTVKDIYGLFAFPDISYKNTSVEKTVYPNPRKRIPIKLFYFESIENSISYILTVFIVIFVLFFLI